jgi:hypothetical protein
LAYLFVEGQQQSIILLIGTYVGVRIEPQIASSRLVQDVIADHILFLFKVINYLDPHLNKHVQHPILVLEKILRKRHHVETCVVLLESLLHAVFFEW